MKMYIIHDSKAEFYQNPIYCRTNDEAKRSFAQAINDPRDGNLMYQSPGDFTLFVVGSFDQDTGVVTGAEKISLGNGLEFRKSDK